MAATAGGMAGIDMAMWRQRQRSMAAAITAWQRRESVRQHHGIQTVAYQAASIWRGIAAYSVMIINARKMAWRHGGNGIERRNQNGKIININAIRDLVMTYSRDAT